MGYFSKFLMTDAGAALIAKLNVEKKPLTYSKVQFGDGFLGSTPVSVLTALKNMVLESGIVSLKQRAQPGRWDVTGLLDNQTLKSDFYFREWGVFAFDPDTNAHVLVLYTNSGDRAELIPAGGGANIIQRQETAAYTIGTATTVTAVITPDFNFLTKEDLAAHNTEPTAHATELAKKADKTQVASDITIAVAAHNTEPTAHGELRQQLITLQNIVTSQGGKIARLDDAIFNDITKNPFMVQFESLTGLAVSGVWNAQMKRIEC